MQVDNFVEPDEADKLRAKEAYEAINQLMEKRDMNSDTLFEDFISERSFNLDRFAEQGTAEGAETHESRQ